jgi:hypothetical protein
MRRSALRTFFERVIVASLPLALAACDGPTGTGGGGGDADLAVMMMPGGDLAAPPGDMAQPPDPGDLAAAPDMTDTCELQHPVLYVNMPASSVPDGGHFNTLCVTGSPCTESCPTGYSQCCSPKPSDGGAYEVSCVYNCGPAGRRPEGLEAPGASDGCALGQYFASMAHLEAASVHAFRSLAHELAAHGAPAHLIAAARRSVREEIRHARLTRKAALAHGGTPAPVTLSRSAQGERRSLEALAIENAVEGCVRETFGALLASYQARAAIDPSVREMMSSIADDETRHAELAWSLDAWTKTRLDRAARRRVVEARWNAVALLAAEWAEAPAPALAARIGLPDAGRSRQLLDALEQELWS